MTDPRMYIDGGQFDELSSEEQLEFLFCPACKRFHNVSLVGRACGCQLISGEKRGIFSYCGPISGLRDTILGIPVEITL